MKKDSHKKTEVKERSPVVVVMGHINHGKSTLLDYIRKSKVVEGEKGGITQHLSAYEVSTSVEGRDHRITFLDTPGHEAFEAIRQRGAKVADIAILIVAADEGVKPQTLEALKCIKAEKLPYIVAINKIDKEGANVEKTRNNLAESEIYLEGYGGDIPNVSISAKSGKGIPELLELIVLSAQLENLEGDSSLPAEGVVVESKVDPRRGVAATLIIKNGTLDQRMYVASEDTTAPVRIMENFLGEKIKQATFSSPVRLAGWSNLPKVGTIFKSFKNKKEAEEFSKKSQSKHSDPKEAAGTEQENSEKVIVPLIIKADTAGSVEAINYEIQKLSNEQVQFKILNSSAGIISEGDVKSALTSPKGLIVGFNIKVDSSAESLAQREDITIKTFDIIYQITDWLKENLKNHLPKIETEEITGKAKIIKVFSKEKDKQVIGGKIEEGKMYKGELFRIRRRESIIGEGKIRELQHKKNTVEEVSEDQEFGTLVESKMDISADDTLEFFKTVSRSIEI